MSRDVESRFFSKVVADPATGCQEWRGADNGVGYGRFQVAGALVLPHRWAWEFARGPIPDGLVLDHLCRNRACVNPDHLEPVSHAENCRRAPGRMAECPDGPGYPHGQSSPKCLPCHAAARRRQRAARRDVA